MKKLFKLKKWLTLDEAATYLTGALSEPVSKADVLRLALDSMLTISVYFIGGTLAKIGYAVPRDQAPKVPGIPVEGMPPYEVTLGFELNDSEVLLFDDPARQVHGVFDLPMIGGERIACEDQYQQITGGPKVELTDLEGAFLRDPESGAYLQLHDQYLPPPKPGDNRYRWQRKDEIFQYPLGTLPDGGVFVVRTESLIRFLEDVEGDGTSDKPLGTRERNTLIAIIAALCNEAKIDYSKPAKAAGMIQGIAASMGVNIGESTIEGHLKKISDALESRMK